MVERYDELKDILEESGDKLEQRQKRRNSASVSENLNTTSENKGNSSNTLFDLKTNSNQFVLNEMKYHDPNKGTVKNLINNIIENKLKMFESNIEES